MASSLILQHYHSHHYNNSAHGFLRRSFSTLFKRRRAPATRAQVQQVASFVEKTQVSQHTVSSKPKIRDAEDWVNRRALAPAVEVDPVTVFRNMISEERQRLVTAVNTDASSSVVIQTTSAPPPPPVLPSAVLSRKPAFPILAALALLAMGTTTCLSNSRRKNKNINPRPRTNFFGKMLRRVGLAKGKTSTDSTKKNNSVEQLSNVDKENVIHARNPTTIRDNAVVNDQRHRKAAVKSKKVLQEGMSGHQNGSLKSKKTIQEGMSDHQSKQLQHGSNGISRSGEGKVIQVVGHTGPSAHQEALRHDLTVQSNNKMSDHQTGLVSDHQSKRLQHSSNGISRSGQGKVIDHTGPSADQEALRHDLTVQSKNKIGKESMSLPFNNSTITNASVSHSENNYNVLDPDRRNVLTLEKPGTRFTVRDSEGLLLHNVLGSGGEMNYGVSNVMPSTDKSENIGLNGNESHHSKLDFMPEQFTHHKEMKEKEASSSLTAHENMMLLHKPQELIHGVGSPFRYPEVSTKDAEGHNFSGIVGQNHDVPGLSGQQTSGQLPPEKESEFARFLTEEQGFDKNYEMSRRQKLENSLPVLAMGLGTFGMLLGGVSQGLEVIGFAAVASLISSELLWAESRKSLQQELAAIKDRNNLRRFLEDRNIWNPLKIN